MKILKRNKGQTLIETAFVLFILVLIALGTVEFARAWYTKSSMKNAARQGARTAVVTECISTFPNADCPTDCSSKPTCPVPCTDCNPLIIYAVCCESPGIKKDVTKVNLTITDEGTVGLNAGDIVTVGVSRDFEFMLGSSSSSWPWGNQTFNTNATMRYE